MVEDDPEIGRLVGELLRREGFEVEIASDASAMDLALQRLRPDLIILDLMLPGEDGLSICRRLRSTDNIPILMLTAKSDEIDRVVGLEMGADDYLVKPFGKQELVARVQALLRRASRGPAEEQAETYADAYLSIDWAQARVTVTDREVQLTPLEFRLLSTFVRHPRQVLSREQLLELVWGDAYGVSGDQVKLYVGYLRRKLVPDAPDAAPIETVLGFGYRYRKTQT
jgi:DNA-binding response OmpR family regulator